MENSFSEAVQLSSFKDTSLQKIAYDACNYFTILLAIKRAKHRLHKQLSFPLVLSACFTTAVKFQKTITATESSG